jgi:hypothetical protein
VIEFLVATEEPESFYLPSLGSTNTQPGLTHLEQEQYGLEMYGDGDMEAVLRESKKGTVGTSRACLDP